jgi:hypothetical protein
MRLCDATDCCVKACGLTVQVQNLYTPAPVPCTLFDDPCYTAAGASCPFPVGNPGRLGCFKSIATPPESCGGMNGVYGVTWVRNCTWLYYGIPAGTGSTQTRGLLTLSGRVWTLRLEGENGQIAVFRSSSWTCGTFPIALAFVAGESTCKSSSPVPSATILSKP